MSQNVITVNLNVELQFLALRLIINMSHRCKLRNRKKVLENFRKFISQEQITTKLFPSRNWLTPTLSELENFNDTSVIIQNWLVRIETKMP